MQPPSQHTEAAQEQQLIELLRAPSTLERGFRLLVQTYQERLYWHIRQLVQQHEFANEVLQNTFIKVYKGFNLFRGDAKLYTWLYRIATNESLTFLKTQQKHQHSEIDDKDSNLANTLQTDPYFDGNHIQALLQEAIALLPEKQKLVFNMRYFQELPYETISEMVGTSVGALKASYHHAAKKIEQYVKEKM